MENINMHERRPRQTYTEEFKMQLIQLYLNGKKKCDILREYDISSSVLDRWIKQAALILGRK